jgi:hypothetical protein
MYQTLHPELAMMSRRGALQKSMSIACHGFFAAVSLT